MIWSKAFWKGAAERGIKTMAQTFVAVVGTGAIGVLEIDWLGVGSVTVMAGILSVMTSVGNGEFVAGSLPQKEGNRGA